MAEMIEALQGLESTTLGIFRTATVVKGGRRFSFAALVVIGDRKGSVGIGYAKAGGVPAAIEKAQKEARKSLVSVVLKDGTLPHMVIGKFGASMVKLIPAGPGTGVIAGGTVRAVLEMAGVQDCLTKAFGSTNAKNLSKAAIVGLQKLRNKETIAAIRGVNIESSTVEEILALGQKYIVTRTSSEPKMRGPVNNVGKQSGGPGGGGRGRGRRGGREGEAPEATEAPAPTA